MSNSLSFSAPDAQSTLPTLQVGFVSDPHGEDELDNLLPVNEIVSQELRQLVPEKQQSVFTSLSQEEHAAVMEKMVAASKQPPGHLPTQEELYLEQQLTDMLGFEITAELDGHRLEHSHGIVAALPHLKRHPADHLNQHGQYQEAGLGQYRSHFGWFTELGQLTPKAIAHEQWYLAVPIDLLTDWKTQSAELKTWYKYRKMILINPLTQTAAVGVVGDIGPSTWVHEQFGASPEIIRETGLWNLDSQGRALLFFVSDPEDTIPLGIRNLHFSPTGKI